MPIDFDIDKPRRRIYARIRGDFSFAEALDAIESATTHPDFEPGFDILDDHSEIGRAMTVAETKDLTVRLERIAPRFAGSRWAIVTARVDSYGTMRMLSALVEQIPIQIQVFRSRDQAEAWLNAPRGEQAP